VIKVDDLSLFAIMEVDVTGGVGGKCGLDGRPGLGGKGGSPGSGGAAGHWTEQIRNTDSQGNVYFTTVSKSSRSGNPGRVGRDGKSAPTPQTKKNLEGRHGRHGRVSFCLIKNSLIVESAGTPYRPAITQQDLLQLVPKPKNFDKNSMKSEALSFCYGQEVTFGPVLPVNVGYLTCPSSAVIFSVSVKDISSIETRSFIPIPPATPATNSASASSGTIPNSYQVSVTMRLPSVASCKTALSYDKKWPWDYEQSRSISINGKFCYQLTVDDATFVTTTQDKDLSSQDYNIALSFPVEIVHTSSGPSSTASLSAPRSYAIGENEIQIISFKLQNKLASVKIPKGYVQFLLRVASPQYPMEVHEVTPKVASLKVENVMSKMGQQKFVTIAGDVPELNSNLSVMKIDCALFLSKLFHMSLLDYSSVGRFISYRPELWFESELVQYGATTETRISAPRPPTQSISSQDVLIFSHNQMISTDYCQLALLFSHLGLRTYFLDYEHFMPPAQQPLSLIPDQLWSAQKGIATIIWMPPPEKATLLSTAALSEHLQRGGKLILGNNSQFSLETPPSTGSAPPYPLLGRSVMHSSETVSLTGFEVDEVTESAIKGKNMAILFVNLISLLSIQDLLNLLWTRRDLLGAVTVSDLSLRKYHRLPDAGCCGCFWLFGCQKTKISPESVESCCVHDLVLATLRTQVMMDLENFNETKDPSHCFCLNEIRRFVSEQLMASTKKTVTIAIAPAAGGSSADGRGGEQTTSIEGITDAIAAMARDVEAVVHASNLLTHKWKKSNKALVTQWNDYLSTLTPALDFCREVVEAHYPESTVVMGERIKDVCVVSGFSVRKPGFFNKHSSVNLSENSQYGASLSQKSLSKKK
jgi:hypothetical protein